MKSFLFILFVLGALQFTFAQITVPQTPAPNQDSVQLWHVETMDGNDYIGSIVREDSGLVVLKTADLGEISIPRPKIRKIEEIKSGKMVGGSFWFENPHASRYLFNPSGYGLRKGEGYYQNVWILFNQAAYGFTDKFTVGAGTIPVFLFGGGVFPYWITPKFSIPIKKERLNASAGVFYANFFGDNNGDFAGLGIVYGSTTFGSRDKNLTLGAGYGFVDGHWAKSPMFAVSGMSRVSRRTFFVTENYLVQADGAPLGILSIGLRRVAKKLAIDVALVRPVSGVLFNFDFIAIPWLSITAPFGKVERH